MGPRDVAAWIAVLGSGCSQLFGLDTPGLVDAPQIDASTSRRKPITILGANVPADLDAFPLWLDVTDSELALGARSDGSDLYFTDASGGVLPHQIQRWTASTGRLEAWVRVALYKGTDTLVYLHYGDIAPGAPDTAGVFSNSFAAVWHLDDTLASEVVADATAQQRNGIASGGLAPASSVAARLGSGFDFDGAANVITFSNPLAGVVPHTISAWLRQRVATSYDSIVVVGNGVDNEARWFHAVYQMKRPGVGFYNNDWQIPTVNLEGQDWTLLHWVFDGTSSTFYRDGGFVEKFQHGSGINTTGGTGSIGNAPLVFGSSNGMNGTLDEVRIAVTARTPEWIAVEYLNQSSPQAFYTVGAAEPAP